jgi:C-terminal processing protease CtpA/Prc
MCGQIEVGDSVLKIDGQPVFGFSPQQVLDRYPSIAGRHQGTRIAGDTKEHA